jgi:hypothetical protein
MRILDVFLNLNKNRSESSEFKAWYKRMQPFIGQEAENRHRVCATVIKQAFPATGEDPNNPLVKAVYHLCQELLDFDKHLYLPKIEPKKSLTTAEIWEATASIKQALVLFENQEKSNLLIEILTNLVKNLVSSLPEITLPEGDNKLALAVPLYSLLPNPALALETAINLCLSERVNNEGFFETLRAQLMRNLYLVSKIDPNRPEDFRREIVKPTKADKPIEELVTSYLQDTPLLNFFETPLPFSIPLKSRFEHMHIVGGSGHGKTQLLQHLILHDLEKLTEGRGTIIVIDSQGDMIRTILHLSELECLSDRLILIDPNDIEYPPALNLFDFGLDRLTRYSPVEREKLVNGAIALYEYLFGALLGAELTQKQGVIFRFLARLMMTVPGATIHTLMQFMDDPETTRPYLSKLDSVSLRFFETQFFSKNFNDTRQQILTRLWGVISNSVLERMFASKHNQVDLFEAMNRGSLILINTAKDLLKQEGCEILGRFFIALIAQAAQERAAIPADKRRSTFLYIDEAHDYFDDSLENLLNQARKYNVGLIIAHQNLDQFEPGLRSTVFSSTSIKAVGGLSALDAKAFAREMRCELEFLQGMRKRKDKTEFACYIRNFTPMPVRLTVPLGEMERRPRLTDGNYEALLEANRARYSAGGGGVRGRGKGRGIKRCRGSGDC